MNDPIGDMLTRIRNASLRGKSTVETPASKGRAWVLDVLADEATSAAMKKRLVKMATQLSKSASNIMTARL